MKKIKRHPAVELAAKLGYTEIILEEDLSQYKLIPFLILNPDCRMVTQGLQNKTWEHASDN